MTHFIPDNWKKGKINYHHNWIIHDKMIKECDLKKLIQLCWSEYRFGRVVTVEQQEFEKLPAEIKYGYLPIPFCTGENFNPDEEGFQKECMKIREELQRRSRESVPFLEYESDWIVADAVIPKVTISPDASEIEIFMEDVVDYDRDPISPIKVHMRLKEVQHYRIMKIENGVVEVDDEKGHLCKEYDCLKGVIQNDYYVIYEDGMYTLLILLPGDMTGWCIEADYRHMEVTKDLLSF